MRIPLAIIRLARVVIITVVAHACAVPGTKLTAAILPNDPFLPPNDNFANRERIVGNETRTTRGVIGATREPGEPLLNGGNTAGQSLWWTWTAPTSGLLRLSANPLQPVPIQLGIFTGTNLTQLTRRIEGTESVALRVNQGTTYEIMLDPHPGGGLEQVLFSMDFSPTPVNDNFAKRSLMSGPQWSTTNDTTAATVQPAEPDHDFYAVGATVWYSWKAPTNGFVRMFASGAIPPVIAVYRGSTLSSLVRVVSSTALLSWNAKSGVTYQIAVAGHRSIGSLSHGEFRLNLNFTTLRLVRPTNGFQIHQGSPFTLAVSTPLPEIDGVLESVAYELHSPFDPMQTLAVSTIPPFSVTVTNPLVGLLALVARGSNAQGEVWSSRPVSIRGKPSNDLFSARVPLSRYEGFINAWNRGATAQPGERNHAGQPASASVWWSWTAPGTGPVTWKFNHVPGGSALAVYTGNALGSLTAIPTQPQYFGTRFNATAGVDYKIVFNSPDAEALLVDRPFELTWDLNSLTLTSPTNQSVFTEGQSIRMAISTTEKTGDIQALDYRSGDNIVTSFSAAPYVYMWTNARAGTHTLSARASTRRGYDVTSDPKTILVRAANDLFTNRRFVEGVDVSLRGWLGGAGLEAGEPDHAPYRPSQSIWWTWIAPRSGRTSIQCVSTGAIPIVAVYEGSDIDALTLVAAFSPFEFDAVAGSAYHIAVARTEEIPFHIDIHMLRAAANDRFADRIHISGTNTWLRSHSIEATLDPGEPIIPGDCGSSGRSLWWSWTAPTNGALSITAATPAGECIRVGVFVGQTFPNLSGVGYGSGVLMPVTAGRTYQIALDTGASEMEEVSAELMFRPTPANDLFAQREVVRGWTFELAGELLGATREPGEPAHFYPWFGPESLWYTWTAPGSGEVFVTRLSSNSIPVLAPYTGDDLATLALVSTNQPPTTQHFSVERGVTYQLALGARGSLSQPVRVLLELWSTPLDPPPLEVQLIPRPSGLRVRVAGLRGYSIELLFSPDLVNWNVAAAYQGDAAFFDHDVETGLQSRGFFRVRAVAPQPGQ